MNKVILLGNIANDIELRQSQNGTMVARFRIACRRSQDETDFISCTAFNKTAELISKHFSKGARILVEGSIKTGSYDDKNTGNKVYTTEVWVSAIDFPEKAQRNANGAQNPSAVTQNAPAPQGQTYNQSPAQPQGQPAYNQQGYQQVPSQPAQPAYQGYPQGYDYGNGNLPY